MTLGHDLGVILLLAGLVLFILSVTFTLGPSRGYLLGSVGLIIVATGLTLIMNEENVDRKWIGYMWLAILTIIGLILGINYYRI